MKETKTISHSPVKITRFASTFFTPFIQPKLTVNARNDEYEREADTVADQVMQMPRSALRPIQRKCADCEKEEELMQRKPLADGITSVLQRKAESDGSGVTEQVSGSLQTRQGNGRTLPEGIRGWMENRFGTDFSPVKVHTDQRAVQLNRELNARAFTYGSDVYFNKDQFTPGTNKGKRLLAHELTHVVQQTTGGGRRATIQRTPLPCAALLNAPGGPSVGGIAAHGVIQSDFNSRVSGATSISIPGASAAPQRTEGRPGDDTTIDPQKLGGKAGTGFPDLARKKGGILEVGEIKPATWVWMAEGIAQVGRYVEQGNATDSAQVAWRSEQGITSVIPMLPSTYSPPSTLIVGSTSIQAAWCGPGLIVYKALKPKEKPYKIPEWKPVPEWDKVLYISLLAAMAAAAKKAGMKLHPAMRVASVAALVILLASGKAEAKISLTGDDPLEALFKVMAQDGVQVPPEVQEMIKNDPELKAMVEKSVKDGAKLSDVQKEAAKQYTEYINKHLDEFSRDELKALLSATENTADKFPPDANVEDLKKAIKKKEAEKAAKEKGGTKEAEGGESGTKEDESSDKEKIPARLSEESKKLIKEAKPPVKKLFEEWLKKDPNGDTKITDEIVSRFFASVPSDLSEKASQELINGLTPGATLEDALESLKKAIEQKKAGAEKDEELDESEDGGDTPVKEEKKSEKDNGIPREEYKKKMLEIIKKKDFSKFKGYEIQREGKKTTLESSKGEKFKATFFQWIKYTSGDGMHVKMLRSAAVIHVEVIAEKPFSVKVTSSSSQVVENGELIAGPTGKVFTHSASKK